MEASFVHLKDAICFTLVQLGQGSAILSARRPHQLLYNRWKADYITRGSNKKIKHCFSGQKVFTGQMRRH